jgi:OAR motif
MASVTWPPRVIDDDNWVLEAMERQVHESRQSVAELRRKAREHREQAAATDIKGVRDAKLALADLYEQEAASRVAA